MVAQASACESRRINSLAGRSLESCDFRARISSAASRFAASGQARISLAAEGSTSTPQVTLDSSYYSSRRDRLFAVQEALNRNRGIGLIFAKSAASADAA
jgi:hypothetical protein